ncbi:MAG: hypothetical protein GY723_04685 [bacterium]|nr:hypothetical protein [bacterium]MCP5067390.1 hypothetical protein [bacterium]
MSEADTKELLSREELAALLDELRAGSGAANAFPETSNGRLVPLIRLLGEFADSQSRALSTLHQRSIVLKVLDVDELAMREFTATLLPVDRVIELRLDPGGHCIYLLLGRSFLFAWLALAFGAKESTPVITVPERHFTRIEERFMRRAAAELVRHLETAWSSRSSVEIRVVDLLEPEFMPQASSKWALASFDVEGLGDLCRLRVLVDYGLYAADAEEAEAPVDDVERAGITQGIHREVLEMPVSVRVEAGFAEVALRRVAALQVGDVIPLERSDSRGLLVRIEEEPKYVAVRGAVGAQLAVQLVESL